MAIISGISKKTPVLREAGCLGFGKAYIIKGSKDDQSILQAAFDKMRSFSAAFFDMNNQSVSETAVLGKRRFYGIDVFEEERADAKYTDSNGKVHKLKGFQKKVKINGREITVFIPNSVKRTLVGAFPIVSAILIALVLLLLALI